MRLALFTDTLTDINGVAHFLADQRAWAFAHNHQLRIFASTRKPLDPTNPANLAHQHAGLLHKVPNLSPPPAAKALRGKLRIHP